MSLLARPPPLSQCVQPGDLVDVYSYDARAELTQTDTYPYTYPAFVLQLEASEQRVLSLEKDLEGATEQATAGTQPTADVEFVCV